MNLLQYKKVCKICDQILRKDINEATVANNFLNIVKEHPFNLKNYEGFKLFSSTIILFKNLIIIFIDLFLIINHSLLKNFYKISYKNKNINKNNKKKVLLISHLLAESKLFDKNDFYFGELEKNLKKNNIEVLKYCINSTNVNSYKLNYKLFNKYNHREKYQILPNYINFTEEFLINSKQFIFFIKYLFLSFKQNKKFKIFIYLNTAIDFLNKYSRYNLKTSYLIREIVKRHNPEYLITTYEGFAWERLVFNSAKKINSKIKCIGYQHAAITKYQHSINRNLGNNYDPDLIWASGNITKKLLRNKRKIMVVGSYKNNNYSIISKFKFNNKKRINCLVIPEGIKSECELMFKFSLDCANKIPGIQFIWRLHPLINFEFLKSKHNVFKYLPSNIIISKKSKILDDIKKSHLCFYRGSSAIINVLSCGVYPIYLNLENKLNIDPVFSLNTWKTNINTVNEFEFFFHKKFINKYSMKKHRLKAINYARSYFKKFDQRKVINYIKN